MASGAVKNPVQRPPLDGGCRGIHRHDRRIDRALRPVIITAPIISVWDAGMRQDALKSCGWRPAADRYSADPLDVDTLIGKDKAGWDIRHVSIRLGDRMTVEGNKAAVRRFTQALDRNELSILPEICTEACAQAWRQGINVDPWADHHIDVKHMIAEGDYVVSVVETHGRIVGNYFGVPGRGKPFRNAGAVVYRFEDGKIAAVDPYFDDLRIVTEQLGAALVAADADR